jgi:hypothetical protein
MLPYQPQNHFIAIETNNKSTAPAQTALTISITIL